MPLRLEIKKKLSARSERVKSVDFHPNEPWILAALYSGHVFMSADTEAAHPQLLHIVVAAMHIYSVLSHPLTPFFCCVPPVVVRVPTALPICSTVGTTFLSRW